jgi:hypothetical protein
MATTHKVVRGDTLWGIAEKYLGSGTKYKQLAAINNISNPNLIYVGQVIKLTSDGGSSSGSTSSNSNKPTINQFGLLSTSDSTLFATWTWSKSNTASYKVSWTYDTGNGVWFAGSNTTISVDKDEPELSKQSTYNIPSGAKKVRFKVKPISATYKKNDTEVNYWDAEWSDIKTYTDSTPVATPSAPSVKIEKYRLTAELDNLDTSITAVQFEVVKNNSASVFRTSQKVSVVTRHAAYSCDVDPGGEYKVRCRVYAGSDVSDWSVYSTNAITIPAAPTGITTIKATSDTSVYLEWAAVNTATSYSIEYTTKKEYFDGSDETTTVSNIEFAHYEKTGLESGTEYFFRVRATNSSGDSAWSPISSVVVGKDPAAPTTWSSTTTAIVGEDLYLYWVHNAEDGSSQTYAEVELYIDGVKETHTIDNSERVEEDRDKTSSYQIVTTEYEEGSKILWRVRTAGVTKTYGDWSVQRTVDIYAPPTLDLRMTDIDGNSIATLTEFPFYIYGLAGPNTQAPIGYHLSITSNEVYEGTDRIGNTITVNVGEAVYSKYFDTSEALLVEMSAGNIDLANNVNYTVTCTASMNSGLTATASLEFTVNWVDKQYEPNAEIGINEDAITASITPYCEDRKLVNYKVNYESDSYVVTAEEVGAMWGEVVKGARTTTGELVYLGVTTDDVETYYSAVEEVSPITDVYLSVYRREFDGNFTELATGLDGAKRTTVIDPHPALDYARYRIVATSKDTGSVCYYDLPGYAVGGIAVIIQWDEAWTNFETSEEGVMEQPAWSGSLLKLPYNIDVSDNHKNDVELIEYIGRAHPIAYYGTQLGQTSTWSMVIPKDDEETLYGLRRLAKWMGNVYVREPSGSGYWASVTVSLNLKHKSVTIPVTINITRVEGGA